MYWLTVLRSWWCAPEYGDVEDRTAGDSEGDSDVLRLPKRIRRRVLWCLRGDESVLLIERAVNWVDLILMVFTLGIMGYAWAVILNDILRAERTHRRSVAVTFVLGGLSIITIVASVVGFYRARMSYTIFTNLRVIKLGNSGWMQWIRYFRLSPVHDEALHSGWSGSTLALDIASPPNFGDLPVVALNFHYVEDVVKLEQLLWHHQDPQQLAQASAQGAGPGGLTEMVVRDPNAPGAQQPNSASRMVVAGQLPPELREALPRGEEVLWWYAPAPWRVAQFSLPSMLMMSLGLIWVLRLFTGVGYFLAFFNSWLIIGTCIAVALGALVVWLELRRARVVYIVTSLRIGVYHLSSTTLLSMGLAHASSVFFRHERSESGCLTAVFRGGLECVQAERRVGWFVPQHFERVSDKLWWVRVKRADAVRERVLPVIQQQQGIAPAHPTNEMI